MKYLADVHNYTADVTIGWYTPIRKRTGKTPDIFALLQFRFYKKVYYHDPNQPYPETKEKSGYRLGLAHNVGDALCYNILTCDTHQVIQRSMVRSASKDRSQNKEASFPEDYFHPTIPDDGYLEISHKYDDLDEGSSVSTTKFSSSIVDEANQIVCRSPRLPKQKPPTPTHGPQLTPELRRSVRNIVATKDSMSLQISIEAHRAAKRKICSRVAEKLVGSVDTEFGGDKFPTIPENKAGSRKPYQAEIIYPMPDHFSASLFAYLNALDQVEESNDAESSLWTPTGIINHGMHKDLHNFVAPMYQVTLEYAKPSWIHASALLYQFPQLVRIYHVQKGLQHTELFRTIFDNT
jgi:hypothetical protein